MCGASGSVALESLWKSPVAWSVPQAILGP
jgi:hypothetical protein